VKRQDFEGICSTNLKFPYNERLPKPNNEVGRKHKKSQQDKQENKTFLASSL
jgi:hypothetical protein